MDSRQRSSRNLFAGVSYTRDVAVSRKLVACLSQPRFWGGCSGVAAPRDGFRNHVASKMRHITIRPVLNGWIVEIVGFQTVVYISAVTLQTDLVEYIQNSSGMEERFCRQAVNKDLLKVPAIPPSPPVWPDRPPLV